MVQNARKLAQALIREYAHEQNFEVSFKENDLLSLVAEVLRREYGCVVVENEFKPGLRVQVPKA